MANNSVTALNTVVVNGAAGGSPAAGNDSMANLGATDPSAGGSGDQAAGWVAGFCKDYGDATLLAGQIFLYVGLALAVAVAAIEVYVAFKTASRPTGGGAGQPERARALTSFPAVIEALKSLLTALSSAKIWLALTILGVLLLWMAATAPRLCVPGGQGDTDASDPQTGNTVGNPSNESAGEEPGGGNSKS